MTTEQMLSAAKTYDTLVKWLPAQIVYEMEQHNIAKETGTAAEVESRYSRIEALCMVLDRMHYTTTWDFRKERFSALYVSAPYGESAHAIPSQHLHHKRG